jgi:hypothetical protein
MATLFPVGLTNRLNTGLITPQGQKTDPTAQLRLINPVEKRLRAGLESRRSGDGFCDHRLVSVYRDVLHDDLLLASPAPQNGKPCRMKERQVEKLAED